MFGSIFTSLSGMNAYTKGLDVISNNVSNLNTPGFKLSTTMFRDLVFQAGGSPQGDAGSLQTRGAGVQANETARSLQQGQMRATGDDLDAAVNGAGFFVLDLHGTRQYTRAGQFEFDKDGILVEKGTGAKVLVSSETSAMTFFDLNTVRVFPPRATTEVTLAGTLARSTTDAAASAYSLQQVEVNDTNGTAMFLTARFTPAPSTEGRATTEVLLAGTLMRTPGAPATAYSLPDVRVYDADGVATAVTARFTPDLEDPAHWTVAIVNAAGTVLGSGDLRFNADGTLSAESSELTVTMTPASGEPVEVIFNFGAQGDSSGVTSTEGTATSQIQVSSQDGAAPGTVDPLQWAVDILNADQVVQGSGRVRFADDGTPVADSASFVVTITPEEGPPFDVRFNLGAPGTFAGVTSVRGMSTSQLQVLKQDGVALGSITGAQFEADGQIKITYSNGESKTPAQIVLARFDAPNLLTALDGSHFAATGSVQPTLGSPLKFGLGSIVGGQVEMSNVDLTNQFTDLIVIQRGFQGCSQITSVANEMMQQLLSMNGNR